MTAPISLVSCVDHSEYEYFDKSGKGLVAITSTLEPSEDHRIRVVTASNSGEEDRGMEFEGIWLSNGGSLVASRRQKRSGQAGIVSGAPSMLIDKFNQYSWQTLEPQEAQIRRALLSTTLATNIPGGFLGKVWR